MVDGPNPVTRPKRRSTRHLLADQTTTVTLSPSGSTPEDGTVMVSGSPAVTLVEKLRATGGWLGVPAVGSGMTVMVIRPVVAFCRSPIG